MHNMATIVIKHQLLLASAPNLRFYDKQLMVSMSKVNRVRKPKNWILHQAHRFRWLSSSKTESKFFVTTQAYINFHLI